MTAKDYKEIAVNRINATNKLENLKHLKSNMWNKSNPFWEWLATQPIDELIRESPRLTLDYLKHVAYHEAGHAVIAHFCNIEVVAISIIPSLATDYRGFTQYHFTDDYWDKETAFWMWVGYMKTLAGRVAERKFSDIPLHKYCMDVINVSRNITQFTEPSLCDMWITLTLNGLNSLISQPVIWQIIEEIVSYLLKYGSIESKRMTEIIDGCVSTLPRIPEIIALVNGLSVKNYEFDEADSLDESVLWETIRMKDIEFFNATKVLVEELINSEDFLLKELIEVDNFYKKKHTPT